MSKEAMKLALELIRQSKIQGSAIDRNEMLDDATKALEEALAKQEQGEPAVCEPVAYIHKDELEELESCNGMSVWAENALVHTDDSLSKQLLPSGYVAIYTAPQQPKPLTDEQIVAGLEAAGVEFHRFMGGIGGSKDIWATSGSQPVQKIAAGVRAMLAAHGIKE